MATIVNEWRTEAEQRVHLAAGRGFQPMAYDAEARAFVPAPLGVDPRQVHRVGCIVCGHTLAVRSRHFQEQHIATAHGVDSHALWVVGWLFDGIRRCAQALAS